MSTKKAATNAAIATLNTPCQLSARTPGTEYPQVTIGGKVHYESRIVLVEKLGRPIADGMIARHTCFNKRCVEPEHIVESSYSENILDADVPRTGDAITFKCGHPRTEANTRWMATAKRLSGRSRHCRTCCIASSTAWHVANRDRANATERARRAVRA